MAISIFLDLSPLQKVIAQLQKSLEFYHSELAASDDELKKQFMAASIQAFEFTYELSTKFIKRFLEISEPNAEVIETMTFPTIIRTANERDLLLNDWTQWKKYRETRNIASHTYDEKKAEEVMKIIPQFLEEAEFLLKTLQQRLT